MLKAVSFDAGGTLFRLRGSVGEIYARHAAAFGIAVDAPRLETRFREAFVQAPALAFPGAAASDLSKLEYEWWRALVTRVFAGQPFPAFDTFFAQLFDYFGDAAVWELFDDTLATLDALRTRGVKLAMISNFDGRLFGICDGLGLSQRFDAIVVSGRAGAAKPDPRIFALALQRLGVTASQALHVGDSQREDVEGARAAGLDALLIQRHPDNSGTQSAIESLSQVIERAEQQVARGITR